MLSSSFEGFSQSLRILLEAVFRSNELILVDPHEVAGNVEQGFTNLLNAFHSLYDSAKTNPNVNIDWYGTPEIATILSIRNARHHNISNRVRGLYTYHLDQENPQDFIQYLILDYPETEDGGRTFQTLISWNDMDEMLSLPQAQNYLRASVPPAIREYLNSDLINSYPKTYDLPKSNIFLNATPLVVNAAMKVVPFIKDHVLPRSLEAKHFINHFENVSAADTKNHIIEQIPVFLPVRS